MVSDPFLVGVFFGFVPAMGFLYLVLREYQSFFSEKRVFRSFFLGLLFGAFLTYVELFLTAPTARPPAGTSVLESIERWGAYALLLGVLEAMAFAAVLNWKTFRGRRDAPFYGVAFGLGFGATNVLFLMGTLVSVRNAQPLPTATWIEAVLAAMLGLYFVGGILVHAAMGAWIGRGSGVGPLPREVLRSAAARTVYVALFYALFQIPWPLASHAIAFLGVGLGIVLIARVFRQLDLVVPPEILREIGIHRRRIARRMTRPEEERP